MKFPRASSLSLKIVLGMLLCVAGSLVFAEEIIFFTNGTAMPIKSHKIIDEMIHVDLGSDGKIAFPERNVERIESAGYDVYLGPSRRTNVTSSGVQVTSGRDEKTAYPARGYVSGGSTLSGSKSALSRREILNKRAGLESPPIPEDAAGLAVVNPLRHSPNQVVRKLGATGNFGNQRTRHARSSSGPVDTAGGQTTALGDHRVIGSITPTKRGSKSHPVIITGITLKDGTPPGTGGSTPPADPPPTGGDSGSGSQ